MPGAWLGGLSFSNGVGLGIRFRAPRPALRFVMKVLLTVGRNSMHPKGGLREGPGQNIVD